jgi:hypothetical protein
MVYQPSERNPEICAYSYFAKYLHSYQVKQVFSHFLAPYVENLDMGLVNLGIVQGKSASLPGM